MRDVVFGALAITAGCFTMAIAYAGCVTPQPGDAPGGVEPKVDPNNRCRYVFEGVEGVGGNVTSDGWYTEPRETCEDDIGNAGTCINDTCVLNCVMNGTPCQCPEGCPVGKCIGGLCVECVSASDCAMDKGEAYCSNDSKCVLCADLWAPGCPKKVLGKNCEIADECDSDQCVDGVCCDSPCKDTCYACNLPGAAKGTCTPIGGGKDDKCPQTTGNPPEPQYCNTGGTCINKSPNEEKCGVDSNCASGKCVFDSTIDDDLCKQVNGECTMPAQCASNTCTNGLCVCNSATDCPANYTCNGTTKQCVLM